MAPDLLIRLRTRWQRDTLDSKLAYGADPMTRPELALRAAQLRSQAERGRIATALERVLNEVSDGRAPAVAQVVPVRTDAVRAHARDVYALTRRLRDDAPIDVRGVAMAARLVSDGAGPLYRDGTGDLAQVVRAARMALDPVAPVRADLATAA
jgi:hypothetical protein